MKKFFFASAALTAMLFTSCSSDEPIGGNGNDGNVTFSVQLPGEIQSRSYGDGSTATTLTYAVYSVDGETVSNVSSLTSENEVSFGTDLRATVTLNLVTGKTYKVVFWADAETSPYTFNATDATITVGTPTNAQDENRDAFFACTEEFTVNGAINQNVALTRPFAQINVGTSDMAEFKAAGGSISKSGLKVKSHNTLNLLTGEVGENTVDFTFENAEFPGEGENFPVSVTGKTFTYLTMNYILVGDDKETVDVTWTSDNTNASEVTFYAVPVQRNYQTNIYGALLTNPAVFNVEIKPGMADPANTAEYDDEGYRIATDKDNANELLSAGEPAVVLDGKVLTATSTPAAIRSRSGESVVEFLLNKTVAHQKLKITGEATAGIKISYLETTDATPVESPKFTLVVTKSLPSVELDLAGADVTINGRQDEDGNKANIENITFTNAASATVTGEVVVDNVTKDENFEGEVEFTGEVEISVSSSADFISAITSEGVSVVNVAENLDLTEATLEDLAIVGVKTINIPENVTIQLGHQVYFTVNDDLTVSGKGTISNEGEELTSFLADGKVLFYVYKGDFLAEDVTLVNDWNYHYNGPTLNSSCLIYRSEANITLNRVKATSGEFVMCGYDRPTSQATVNLTDCYMESNSSYSWNGSSWSYAVRICGKKSLVKNCTIIGVQGGLSPEHGVEMTIDGGDYSTHYLDVEKKTGNPYSALYVTNEAKVTILDGKFWSPVAGIPAAEGSLCVRSGDNDVNFPDGTIYLKGGKYNGKAFSHVSNNVYSPVEGYQYVKNVDADSTLYTWKVVKISE